MLPRADYHSISHNILKSKPTCLRIQNPFDDTTDDAEPSGPPLTRTPGSLALLDVPPLEQLDEPRTFPLVHVLQPQGLGYAPVGIGTSLIVSVLGVSRVPQYRLGLVEAQKAQDIQIRPVAGLRDEFQPPLGIFVGFRWKVDGHGWVFLGGLCVHGNLGVRCFEF